jgi:hypothetical protein
MLDNVDDAFDEGLHFRRVSDDLPESFIAPKVIAVVRIWS